MTENQKNVEVRERKNTLRNGTLENFEGNYEEKVLTMEDYRVGEHVLPKLPDGLAEVVTHVFIENGLIAGYMFGGLEGGESGTEDFSVYYMSTFVKYCGDEIKMADLIVERFKNGGQLRLTGSAYGTEKVFWEKHNPAYYDDITFVINLKD